MKSPQQTNLDSKLEKTLSLSLLFLRLSIALVFMVWAFDKIVAPEHTAKVFADFYNISLPTSILMGLGFVQVTFVTVFALGLWRNFTYLALLVLHAGSTFSAFAKYLDPFNNLLFFAAWPMLAACLALYLLRDYDSLTLSKEKQTNELAAA